MKKLKFMGHSDDTFGEYGTTMDDIDNCGSCEPVQCVIEADGTAARRIDQMPATDVQPVKHGTWSVVEQGYDAYIKCSECSLELSMSNYIADEWRDTMIYCPRCGVKMNDERTV